MKKAGLKNANLELLKEREAEKRKLKAEIYAMEHPGSYRAKEGLKSAFSGLGRSIKRNANLVADNAVRLENARKERVREEKKQQRELELARLKRRTPTKKRKAPIKRRKRKSSY